MKTLCILVLIAFFQTVHARLGETTEEIQARYGKPKLSVLGKTDYSSGLPQSRYEFKDYKIRVVFKDGKSICETVEKKNDSSIDEDETFELVKAISGDTSLEKGRSRFSWEGDAWRAIGGGGQVVAQLKIYDQIVKDYKEFVAKERSEQAKKKADGF